MSKRSQELAFDAPRLNEDEKMKGLRLRLSSGAGCNK